MTAKAAIRGLYAITPEAFAHDALVAGVEAALCGGARVIQLRSKQAGPERERAAFALARACARHGAVFIVNDDVALARACGAGVHLGREDMPLARARAALGSGAVIGVSCYDDLERARAAAAGGADYVAFGSFFPSATKPHAARAQVALLHAARAAFALPLVAIGGITPENGAALLAAGADALAAVEGVFGSGDTEAAARRYAALFNTTTTM